MKPETKDCDAAEAAVNASHGRIVRVQDRSGRGPWRPGFSKTWTDDHSPMVGRPIFEEPGFISAISIAKRDGLFIGCGVRESLLHLWFSPSDRARLGRLGFRMVDASACNVLLETDQQVLFGSRAALSMLPILKAGA